ncbi:alpha/beta-hydrolase [Trematosphaeria pertusa]|uniref:Alpha/beta-hydrolase n=1 Tax=Trematosphaeria pertusa TaxID=390896 RepID=A0A6A6J6N0_9PLEO|nr:alpha/beta-hydrolase [Trematosphaeria pertusa]KAF2257153.1 alpha/beta-hydrolase [Trematosphaeria pertusa]
MPFFNPSPSLSLFYTLHGPSTNPPILLIHGWCCDSHDWSWQIPFLTQTHYVIATDMRGHGRSSAPAHLSYTLQDQAADAAALLRHLELEKDVLVMGHSMGAMAASVLSVLEPELVKGIVLIDPPYHYPSKTCDETMAWYAASPSATTNALQSYPSMIGAITPEWMKLWYLRRLEGTPEHVIRKSIEGCFGEEMLGRAELHEEFVKGKRKAPRLAVYKEEERAERERAFGVDVGRGDEVVVIGDGAGHWPHQTRSEEFNGLLGRWLTKIGTE